MKAATAITKFINSPGYNSEMIYPSAKIQEIKSFKEACSPEEWATFGRQAAEALGEVFEENE